VRESKLNGRVRHDDRGNAVWDLAMDTGMFNTLSSSAVMRQLEVAELKVQESPGLALAVAGRDAGGGGDPYNRAGSANHASAPRRLRFR